MATHGARERRVCRVVVLSRSVNRYEFRSCDYSELIEALGVFAKRHPRFGFRKLFTLLRRAGHSWHHNRVRGGNCSMKPNRRRRFKKRYRPEPPSN